MLTKTSKAYGEIRGNLQGLLEGIVVSIDPSIGSNSSMPGYAVYRKGILQASGTIDIVVSESVPDRLRQLANAMRKLYNEYKPDILVYEDIPAQRHGGGNANAHASLLKAVGVILSIPGPSGYVGLLPISWKKMVRDDYTKSDVRDAEEIGWIAIECARYIAEKDPPGVYGRRKRRVH